MIYIYIYKYICSQKYSCAHVSKCMSYHEDISKLVITEKAHGYIICIA